MLVFLFSRNQAAVCVPPAQAEDLANAPCPRYFLTSELRRGEVTGRPPAGTPLLHYSFRQGRIYLLYCPFSLTRLVS